MKGDFLILTDGKLRVGEFPNPNIDFSLTLRKVQLVVYFGRVSGCWWDVIRLVIWRMHSKFTIGQRQIRSCRMLKTEWIII